MRDWDPKALAKVTVLGQEEAGLWTSLLAFNTKKRAMVVGAGDKQIQIGE